MAKAKNTYAVDLVAPMHLTDAQRLVWDELVSSAPTGTLSRGDRATLEMTACLMVDFRADPSNFSPQRLATLTRLIGMLGLAPKNRRQMEAQDSAMRRFLAGP